MFSAENMTEARHLPEAAEDGNLPPGNYYATLDEVAARFVRPRRQKRQDLTSALVKFIRFVLSYGPTLIFIDGSYVTDKLMPSDVDIGIVFPETFDLEAHSWRFLNRSDLARGLDVKLFRSGVDAQRLANLLRDWTTDLETGRPKGIVYLEIQS